MGILKNKLLIKLIASICLFLTLLNFTGVSKVYAVWGGVLIKPITNLFTGIGDSIMDILHSTVQSQDVSLIKVSGDTNWQAFWKTVGVVVCGILAAVAFVVVAPAAAGLANAALAVIAGGTFSFTMGTVTVGTLLGGVAIGVCVGIRAGNAWFPDDIYLPAYTLSAEEIFSDQILLFDVNFFNPKPGKTIVKETEEERKFHAVLKIYVRK